MAKWEVTYLSKVTIEAKTMEEAADRVQDVLEENEGGAVLSVNEVTKDACGPECGCK